MKAAYHLAIALFSAGAFAVPTTAPNATGPIMTSAFPSHVVPEAMRNIAADLSVQLSVRQESMPIPVPGRRLSVGDSLPKTVELHPIPQHETYRYAVVDNHRVIVDAASRKVIYLVQ